MRRIVKTLVVALILVSSIAVIFGYRTVVSMEVERVTDDVHVIYGFGGNVGVLRTGSGAVVVDTMTFRFQGRQILERSDAIAGPVRAIVNTHYHGDHTHGNPAFASGGKVVATRRTLAYMLTIDTAYWMGDTAHTLPNETFDEEHELRLGDKTIRLIHPGPGHTDGDLVVLFVEDRVLHAGDLFFNDFYPGIDLEAGGSVRDWVVTLDRVLELDFDAVIPGHGPVGSREDLLDFQRFLQQLAAVAEQAASDGLTLEETLVWANLDADAGYREIWVPFVVHLNRDFVLRRAWEEATGNFQRIKVR